MSLTTFFMANDKGLEAKVQRIELLVGKIETLADPGARADARELVQSLMDLHGAGIERMLEMIAGSGDHGMQIIDQFARDKLVASLLLLYGLHPLDFETRVIQALDKLRPNLQSHGGNVELVGIVEGEVQLRLRGGGSGCGSPAQTLKLMIEEALSEAAPDITALHVEPVAELPSLSGLVKLQGRAAAPGRDDNGWAGVKALAPHLSDNLKGAGDESISEGQ